MDDKKGTAMTDKRVEAMVRAASNAVHELEWDEFKRTSHVTAATEIKRIKASIAADPVTEDVKGIIGALYICVERLKTKIPLDDMDEKIINGAQNELKKWSGE